MDPLEATGGSFSLTESAFPVVKAGALLEEEEEEEQEEVVVEVEEEEEEEIGTEENTEHKESYENDEMDVPPEQTFAEGLMEDKVDRQSRQYSGAVMKPQQLTKVPNVRSVRDENTMLACHMIAICSKLGAKPSTQLVKALNIFDSSTETVVPTLNLRNIIIRPQEVSALKEVIPTLVNNRGISINVANCDLGWRSCEILLYSIAQHGQILSLDISGNRLCTSIAISRNSDAMRRGPATKSWDLSQSDIKTLLGERDEDGLRLDVDEETGNCMDADMELLTGLNELDISPSAGAMIALSAAVQANRNMELLNLSKNGVSSYEFSPFINAVASTRIKHLDLSLNPLGTNTISMLVDVLGRSEIVCLKLGGCCLDERSTFELAKLLVSDNKKLKRLDLSGNNIGDNGTAYLLSVFVPQTSKRNIPSSVKTLADEHAVKQNFTQLVVDSSKGLSLDELDLSRCSAGIISLSVLKILLKSSQTSTGLAVPLLLNVGGNALGTDAITSSISKYIPRGVRVVGI